MAQPFHHNDRFVLMAIKARANGATSETHGEGTHPYQRWICSGDCEAPVYREIKTTASFSAVKPSHSGGFDKFRDRHAATVIEMSVRCRRCKPCLLSRASAWRIRAEIECARSIRTWFGTLTLSPQEHFKALCLAKLKLASRGVEFDRLSETDQFLARDAAISPEIVKYLKRLRAKTNANIRYMLVCEAHKSGLPHYHLLVHQCSDIPVKHRDLSETWKLGFSNFKLVADAPKSVGYVCKYLSKTLSARVRASLRYGSEKLCFQPNVLRHSEPTVIRAPLLTTPPATSSGCGRGF